MVQTSLLFGGFSEVQTNFATTHKSLIKSEGTTSTFSQAVLGALIQQLWQAGLSAWPAVFLCWSLIAK